jgi:hypothetical protein
MARPRGTLRSSIRGYVAAPVLLNSSYIDQFQVSHKDGIDASEVERGRSSQIPEDGSHCSVAEAVMGLARRAEDQGTGGAGKAMVSRQQRSIVRVVGRKKERKKGGSK